MELPRIPEAYAVFSLDLDPDSDEYDCCHFESPCEAWSRFAEISLLYQSAMDQGPPASPAVFVGVGDSPVKFSQLKADATKFQVFDATLGRPVSVGDYSHRLQAMQAAKQIVSLGGCPVVVSPHLPPVGEWLSDRVISSAVVSGERTDASQSIA